MGRARRLAAATSMRRTVCSPGMARIVAGTSSPGSDEGRDPQRPAAPEQRGAGGDEVTANVAETGVRHLVAFERRGSATGSAKPSVTTVTRSQRIARPSKGPARAGHPEAHAAKDGARRAVAAGAIERVLAEDIEDEEERHAGEGLQPLGLEAGDEIDDVDRHEHGQRDQEADQKLPRACRCIRSGSPPISRVRPRDAGGCR